MKRHSVRMKSKGIIILTTVVCLCLRGVGGGTATAQTLTTLYQFCSQVGCDDGQSPNAGLVQGSDGNFYGTTYTGAAFGNGTVFKITPQGTLTTLYLFGLTLETDGVNPNGVLVQGGDGNFYGTTTSGGTNDDGTVFAITSQGTLTTLYQFCGQPNCSDGSAPYGGLVQADGSFYGVTQSGGSSDDAGTVFSMTPQGTLTTLYQFSYEDNNGAVPNPGLVQGGDGNFYGSTSQGGTNDNGTVFRITPQGTLTAIYQFDQNDFQYQSSALVQGTDGNFYGTTQQAGTNDEGTVFSITPQGTFTTLYQFSYSDGATPVAGLVQFVDGDFYGTTSAGGANGAGTIFRITPQGTLTTLYQFCDQPNCSDGSGPSGGLVWGSDKNFYGTTSGGGTNDSGTVFEFDVARPLQVKKLQATVNLNPAKKNGDTCSLTAIPALEPGFSVTNQSVMVSVGNVEASFTLNAKGRVSSSTNSCTLSYAKKTGVWTLTVSMKKGTLAPAWAGYGVTNATTAKAGVTVSLPVTALIGKELFESDVSLNYKAVADKSGTLK